MSNSKQKIISELKSKISQFKSKLKSPKPKNDQDEQKTEEELILKLPLNKNISKEINSNKENINNNNIILNRQIKPSKIERANSTCATSFNINKKYLDFDFDKLLSKTKTNSKTNICLDELNHSNKNKTFINLNLNTKTITERTNRQKELFNSFNNNEYLNKYEANHTEPNAYNFNYNTLKSKNNNLFQNNFFSKNNITPLTKIQNERERLSAKPEIKTNVSRYNLNFMMNDYNKNKSRKNSAKLFYNNSINKIENSKENYSMNINNILNGNTRKNNFNVLNDINNKYLTSSNTVYNFNSYNAYNSFNKGNKRKNYIFECENNNNSINSNINVNDIHRIKYMIQNLSSNEINNLPISVFKEMKELYDLIYMKFLKNNYI